MSGRRPVELVIFDCDGVLVDSEPLGCRGEAEVLTGLGYPITSAAVAQRFVGISVAGVRAQVERELGRALPDDFEARLWTWLDAAFRRELAAMPGIHDALDALGRPVCVASSSAPPRIRLCLELTGLHARFAPHLFSAVEVPNGKPAPDLFLHAAARLAVPPACCLVIEDSLAGVQAARAAGMAVFGFCGGSHCGPDHAARLRAAGAALTFAEMARLPALLRAHEEAA